MSRAAEEFTAALAWWREAGVEFGFDDAPRDWLAPPPNVADAAPAVPSPALGAADRPRPAPGTTPPPAPLGGDPAGWPNDLAGFAEWWLSEPTLAVGEDRHRVAPRGPAGAALMALVPEPEVEDREQLLAGPQGRLLAAIYAAFGLAKEQVYVASALPSHVGLIDWPGLTDRNIAALTAHHVALARPERVLLFGRDCASALLRHDPPRELPSSPYFHHDPWQLDVACAPLLENLLERPNRKAGVWQTLLNWGS